MLRGSDEEKVARKEMVVISICGYFVLVLVANFGAGYIVFDKLADRTNKSPFSKWILSSQLLEEV